ncbi:MAG: Mrp/NBP35 family ATP-binding protein [Thermodesulfobacteriota bacterium]|nr:Mrp/NBP35 family ATP-binding protein [Thermodesulfobacteriota bacterium]
MEQENRAEREAKIEALLQETVGKIKHKFMVMSGKGGVGKSTVAANLAVAFAKKEYAVGLLDADIHGPNIPKILGLDLGRLGGGTDHIEPVHFLPNLEVVSMAFLLENRDSPIVWRGPLKHAAFKQFLSEVHWGDLDFLIVDLPPGTGDEPLSIAQLIKDVDGSIIVTTPQDVALLDSRKAVHFSEMMKVPVAGIIENMSGLRCPHCGKTIDLFKTGGGEKAALEMKVPFLGRIPIDPEIVQLCDQGKAFVEMMPESEAAEAFIQISTRCEEFAMSRKKKEVEGKTTGISKIKEFLR